MSDLLEEYKWSFKIALIAESNGGGTDSILAELSDRAGALVAKSWQKGSRVSQRADDTRLFSASGVRLQVVPKGRVIPEEAIAALLQEINAHGLVELLKGLECQMTIVLELFADYGTPPFGLSTDTVQFLADIGADIDVDLYVSEEKA